MTVGGARAGAGAVRDPRSRGLTEAGRRVLAAAGDLFYHRGIGAVGVAEVAETAGVTKKTLYDCFGSKAALVVAYLEDRDRRWWGVVEERLATAGTPRALTLFDAYLDHPDLALDRGCAFLDAAAELPADHPGLAVIARHKDAVRARLTELVVAEGGSADTADAVFLLLEGAMAQQRLGHGDLMARARALCAARL